MTPAFTDSRNYQNNKFIVSTLGIKKRTQFTNFSCELQKIVVCCLRDLLNVGMKSYFSFISLTFLLHVRRHVQLVDLALYIKHCYHYIIVRVSEKFININCKHGSRLFSSRKQQHPRNLQSKDSGKLLTAKFTILLTLEPQCSIIALQCNDKEAARACRYLTKN